MSKLSEEKIEELLLEEAREIDYERREATICCICGEEYDGFGNNAEPTAEGRCCDECNIVVLLDRVSRMEQDENNN